MQAAEAIAPTPTPVACCTYCRAPVDPELAFRSEDGPEPVEWVCRECAAEHLRDEP